MIYTIGYQRLGIGELSRIMGKLKSVLVDVRSNPHGKYADFRQKNLIKQFDYGYEYHGDTLGGRTPIQEEGIKYLGQFYRSKHKHCLLMCMEHEPAECHRHLSITLPYFPDAIHIYDGDCYLSSSVDSISPSSIGSL
jgi:uncharacterized protein (DUF488 family)